MGSKFWIFGFFLFSFFFLHNSSRNVENFIFWKFEFLPPPLIFWPPNLYLFWKPLLHIILIPNFVKFHQRVSELDGIRLKHEIVPAVPCGHNFDPSGSSLAWHVCHTRAHLPWKFGVSATSPAMHTQSAPVLSRRSPTTSWRWWRPYRQAETSISPDYMFTNILHVTYVSRTGRKSVFRLWHQRNTFILNFVKIIQSKCNIPKWCIAFNMAHFAYLFTSVKFSDKFLPLMP